MPGRTESDGCTDRERWVSLRSTHPTSLIVVALWTIILVASPVNAKPTTVAYPSPSWNTSLPVSTAKGFGIFAAEGLEVRPVYVRGGPIIVAASLSGEADFAFSGDHSGSPLQVPRN